VAVNAGILESLQDWWWMAWCESSLINFQLTSKSTRVIEACCGNLGRPRFNVTIGSAKQCVCMYIADLLFAEVMEDKPSGELTKPASVKRPMNAFLIFCKRKRGIVREQNPHIDNRSVTRLLGDLWANLDVDEKSVYTDLAKQVSFHSLCHLV